MSDDQRADAFLAKAAESLAGAESECAMGRFNNCANRAYYACFQAAIAALIRAGYGPSKGDREWRHDAIAALFTQQLVNRRKMYPAAFRGELERGAALRAMADNRGTAVRNDAVLRFLRLSRTFVTAIRDERASRR